MLPGIDEVMIGLNDLHLQFGVANHFEVLASPLIDMMAAEVLRKGLPLAIGGVGRVGDTAMPVPTDLVYGQYPRLHATGAWLARSFTDGMPSSSDFATAVLALRRRLSEWAASPTETLERARGQLARYAAEWRQASSPAQRVAEVGRQSQTSPRGVLDASIESGSKRRALRNFTAGGSDPR